MIATLSVAGVGRLIIGALFLLAVGNLPSAYAQDMDEKIAFCTSCHGEDGRPIESDIPIIWGQEYYYLYVQLKDYKSGLRANEIMGPIVAEMSTIGYRAEDAEIPAAQSALVAGLCAQCHLGSYLGDSRVPRLAGQQPDYLERTMNEFQEDIRLNSPAKGSLMEAFEDSDIQAMAHYLAGL